MKILKSIIVFGLFLSIPFITTNCIIEDDPVEGCTCATAANYDPEAEEDDGSCMGCLNNRADNYSSCSDIDAGGCVISGCTDSNSASYNPEANFDDGSCTYEPFVALTTGTAITHESITFNGVINDDGSSSVTAYGFTISSDQDDEFSSARTYFVSDFATGDFELTLSGLKRNSRYFASSFATNAAGTDHSQFVEIYTDSEVHDVDGNKYSVVEIGDQVWLAENLTTRLLNDGTSISTGLDDDSWVSTTSAAYSWPNGSQANSGRGALYNWYAVDTDKLCPVGWHVPNKTDFDNLMSVLGGTDVAGGKLKSIGTSIWDSPNVGATNESGFSAIPAGERGEGGTYFNLNIAAIYWTTSEENSSRGIDFVLSSLHDDFFSSDWHKYAGNSVRCIED